MRKIYSDENGQVKVGTVIEGYAYEITAGRTVYHVTFQEGSVKEVGLNGVTSEALIAILIDRTKILNKKFPCKQNEEAIKLLERSLGVLEDGTKGRIKRKVEGTNKK